MSGPELSVVSFVLRCQRSAGALHDLGPTISRFLGPSPCLPFHQACSFGSIVLLDWIWRCSCTSVASRPSNWSLVNFLRSDLHYHRWEFCVSMEMAAGRGDLEIIKWLFTHFSDCQVPLEAVKAAASNGHLSVLQYLLDHDANNQRSAEPNIKKRKVVTESGELVSVGDSSASAKATRIVCWDTTVRREHTNLATLAVKNGHFDVARWLYDNITTERGFGVEGTINAALKRNDMALAQSFLPPGGDIMECTDSCTLTFTVEMIQHMLDSGSLQSRSYIAVSAINDLVRYDRLDLMQRIANLNYFPRRNNTEWADDWQQFLRNVCSHGNIAMVRWATGHPTARRACRLFKRYQQLSELLWLAVAGGNSVEVLQCLKDAGFVDKYGPALVEAVAKNDLSSIKWLLDNFPQSEQLLDYCLLSEAAKFGHLRLLKYFQRLPSSVPGFVTGSSQIQEDERGGEACFDALSKVAFGDEYRKVQGNRIPVTNISMWKKYCYVSTDAMDNAAANGHLEIVQWLHANRTEGCTTDAMDCAAANGHLDVVKWLQANRSEGLTTKAMYGAAANGHLHMVQWLHGHTSAGCTSYTMDRAAEHGHLSIVKWLHTNRTEGCSSNAVKKSLQNDHLAVASWLKRTYPLLKPPYVELSWFERVFFPVVLFMQEHYVDILNRETFGENTFNLEDIFNLRPSSDAYIKDWLQENGLEP